MTISSSVLERAGIHLSPEEFEQLVLAAVRQVAPSRLGEPGRDLTPEQVAALRRGGIDPLAAATVNRGTGGSLTRGTAMYAALLATSL
ncbi:MAG TPA: hypothetical protein VKX96_01820, partial [Chloroflexota bacterium]|nr:hypothetical protein [Chloroflexota bacterium]